MLIRITPRGHESAARSLNGARIRPEVTAAIRRALREGKQEGTRLTDERYTTKINRLGKVSIRASALRGRLTVTGGRNLIKRFKLTPSTRPPHNPPGGLHVQIVKGAGGYLRHAFVNSSGVVLERTGRKRLPVKHLSTVSLPGAWERFSEHVEETLARHVEKRLEELL